VQEAAPRNLVEVVAPAKVSHSLCVEDSVIQAAMSEQVEVVAPANGSHSLNIVEDLVVKELQDPQGLDDFSSEDEEQYKDLICLFPRSELLGSFFAIPLGFYDPEMENLYHKKKTKQTEERLLWFLRFVSVTVILLFGLMLPSPLTRQTPWSFVVFVALNFISPPLLLLLVLLVIRCVPRSCKDVVLVSALSLGQAMFVSASPARLALYLDVPASQVAPLDVGYSDSAVVASCGIFIVTAFSLLHLRCRSLLPMVLWVPCCYLALSLPLPENIAEQNMINRLYIALGLLGQNFVALAARSYSEMADRVSFASQVMKRREILEEKMQRMKAEHEAAHGPFSEKSLELGRHSSSYPLFRQRLPGPEATGTSSGNHSSDEPGPEGSGCPSSSAFNMNITNRAETEWVMSPEGTASITPLDEKMARIVEMARNEHWLIEAHELELLPHCELGRGGFGKVVVGRLYGLPVAVKMSKSIQTLRGMSSLVNELRIFRRLRHPNIVMFHGACVDIAAGEVLLVEEVVPGATLSKLITPPPSPVRTRARCVILLRICKALRYLHMQTPAIMHGDLKPGNILVPQSMQPKLTDFGLSRMIKNRDEGIRFQGGTIRWSAPESLMRGGDSDASDAKTGEVTISADIWSLGRVCYFTVTGVLPLETFGPDATPSTGENVPLLEECLKLCARCGQTDPTARPSISEVHKQIWQWLPRKPCEADHFPSMAEWLLDDTLLPPDAVPEPDSCRSLGGEDATSPPTGGCLHRL